MEEVKANQRIREAVKESGMYYWQLADLMRISSWTLSVKLRHELPQKEQNRIVQLIRENSNKERG